MTDAAPADGQSDVRPPQKPEPSPAVAGPPAGLWDRMREDPQYAPEHLALAAVRQLGPEAVQWARRVRAEQPGTVPVEALAEQAVRRFVNHARFPEAASGATGLPGLVIDLGLLAWTQARMVLHVAAAYGLDATHHDRAVDLLVLQKVHKTAQGARLALGVADGRERADALFGSSAGQAPLGQVTLRLGARLAQMAGARATKRVVAKVLPGVAIILGTWANSSATKELATRSQALYRQHSAVGCRCGGAEKHRLKRRVPRLPR
ncbi:EcsC family protein [Salinispora fenicalii]|uniref:EcsC family protein n=1 Tax=Salinispora fenicalii TaxID=1137263 RepID=UPI0004B811A0|nr:EcsC family protein [Salinispora fenicalii]